MATIVAMPEGPEAPQRTGLPDRRQGVALTATRYGARLL